MKQTFTTILLLSISAVVTAQIKYDDGPIKINSQDFVTIRGWDHTNLTYFFKMAQTILMQMMNETPFEMHFKFGQIMFH